MSKRSPPGSTAATRPSFRAGFDPKKLRELSAFQLGYTSYLVPYYDRMEDFADHIFRLKASLDELVDSLNPAALSLFLMVLNEIEHNVENSRPLIGSGTRLIKLGSRLLSPKSRLLPWYRLGAAMGSYVQGVTELGECAKLNATVNVQCSSFCHILEILAVRFVNKVDNLARPLERFWQELVDWVRMHGDEIDHVALLKKVTDVDAQDDAALQKLEVGQAGPERDVLVIRHLMEKWFSQICAAIHPEGDAPYWFVEPVDVMANQRTGSKNPVLAQLRAMTARLNTLQPPSDWSLRERNDRRDQIIRRVRKRNPKKNYREVSELVRLEPEIEQLNVTVSRHVVRDAVKRRRGK
jgi:hypothetical protein